MQDTSADVHSSTQILGPAITYMYTAAVRGGTVSTDSLHSSFTPEPGTGSAHSRCSESFMKTHMHASEHTRDGCAHVDIHICAQEVACSFTAF